MDARRRLSVGVTLLLGLIVTCFGLWLSSSEIISVVGMQKGQIKEVDLPWVFQGSSTDNRLVLELETSFFSPKVWHIIPDEQLVAILVDNQLVSLEGIPANALTDYGKGFQIDLSAHLTPGKHTLDIRFNNQYGPGGMKVEAVWGFWRYACIYGGVLIIMLGLSRWFRLRPMQKWILGFALIPLFLYWSATSWLTRAHDVSWGGGHYDYIEYIATKKALPKPQDGWVFYHPPVYYLVGAVVWQAANVISLPVHETLQLLSLLFWLVFLVSSFATINIFLRNRPGARFVASLGLALWPAGILHSPAIGNDSVLYACLGLATLYMCRWWFSSRRRDLLWTALFCALSVLIKTNALVIIGVAGLLLLLRFFLRRKRKKLRAFIDGVLFGLIAFTALLGSLAVRIYYYAKGESANWMISNVGNLHSGLRVPADFKAFIPIDIPTFLTQPYVHAFDPSTGRNSFWIYLLRSSLSGEFAFNESILPKIAYLFGLLMLILFFSVLFGLPRLWKTKAVVFYRHLPLFLLGIIWLISLIALRIQVPFACSNDFRYILPIILPLVIFWSTRGLLIRWTLVLMALSSAVFYSMVGLV